MSMVAPVSLNDDPSSDFSPWDLLLDEFSVAAQKSVAAAEAAALAETLAAAKAEEAAEAYLAAAAAVGTPDFEKLKGIAEAAERMLESLTTAAATASQDYLSASAKSMHASAALEAAESFLYDDDNLAIEEERTDPPVQSAR